jgi:L-rhamnose mutarotase
MMRHAFKMNIPLEHAAEYKLRHDAIWPELVRTLQEAGVFDYTIYLDEETGILFATMKLEENNQLEALAEKEIVKKWWAFFADIMTYEDGRPMVRPLREVFHLG